MTISLDAKNKLCFVDGSLPRPEDSHPHSRIWSRCNSMVKSWILNSVNKQIYGSILRFQDASDIWKDLMVRFQVTNLPHAYQLSQKIWSFQQGTMDLSSYYTRLKTLWDDLECTDCIKMCKNCSCCKAMAEKTENARVVKFLSGLNESYNSVRSQIIMKKHLPDLSGVYNLIDQDHNQRNIQPVVQSSVFQVSNNQAIQPSVNASNANTKSQRPVCTHCAYNGHTIDKCYKIHGYPPNFKHKQKSNSSNSTKTSVSQFALTDSASVDITSQLKTLSKDQIEGVIAFFNSQLNLTAKSSNTAPSTSGGTITALPGSYQGADDWTS